MKSLRNIINSAFFLSILISSLLVINQLLLPKYIINNSDWPTTSSYSQFYRMEENSIDVLFLGSSVVVNAFIPQEIYNNYGIGSYNLGSEQQSIFLSYYWLKEALRFQSPKVVVLDMKFMWDLHPDSAINTTEGLTRKCLDPMKWSPVKCEAVHSLCNLDKEQSELSYYLTNIRFHSRWSDKIEECDFSREMINNYNLMGFSPLGINGAESYETYENCDAEVCTDFNPIMQKYLDLIVELCNMNNISLVLVELPGNEMNDSINNAHVKYAQENGIEYYNLCSTEYYNLIGAKLPEENIVNHANYWGAVKLSQFIGKMLNEKYGLQAVRDEQYENANVYYENIKNNLALSRITDTIEYLGAINKKNYAVFMVTHGDATATFNQEYVLYGLYHLGLECKYLAHPENRYAAVIIEGNVLEERTSYNPVDIRGSFRNQKSNYYMQSGGIAWDAYSSIEIDGGQYSMSTVGLNITVYDLNTSHVIDQTTIQGLKVIHAD